MMMSKIKKWAENESFHTFILNLIILNAISMGMETIPHYNENYGEYFNLFFLISQIIFVVEITVRIIAYAPDFANFFKDFWNKFDFFIIAASLVPAIGSLVLIARLLRILRVIRVLSVSDKIRKYMTDSGINIPITFYSFITIIVFIYIYSITGYYLFSEVDPVRWHSLGRSFLSVCYIYLLQDIALIAEPLLRNSVFNLLYFVLIYLTGLHLLIQLIASTVINGKSEKTND